MKLNLNALKNLFGKLAKSGMADDVARGVANVADDVAPVALDMLDDMPTSISFDDIADAYKNRIPVDKPPITPSEFVSNYKAQMPQKSETRQMLRDFPDMFANAPTDLDLAQLQDLLPEEPVNFKLDSTPDYAAMDIRPERFGQSPHSIDHILYPDGFEDPEDFAKYYDALEQGFATKELYPYTYPTYRRVPYRSPVRVQREIGVGQAALDPYAISGDVPANSPKLSELYKKITGTY